MQGIHGRIFVAHNVVQDFMQKIARRGQLRLLLVAFACAFVALLMMAPHAVANCTSASDQALHRLQLVMTPDGWFVSPEESIHFGIHVQTGAQLADTRANESANLSDCIMEIGSVTEMDPSLSIAGHVGARSDTESMMDEEFEIAPSASSAATILRQTALQSGPVAAVASGEIAPQARTLTAEFMQMGLPDGMRASGVYAIDGGYGLAEPIYADLVASLLSE